MCYHVINNYHSNTQKNHKNNEVYTQINIYSNKYFVLKLFV